MTVSYPPFDLLRLLQAVFDPQPGERIAILIDLDDPPSKISNLPPICNLDKRTELGIANPIWTI